ncbi:MAG: alpha/beta hydrolase [Actinobacteria bacterium]|jgi:pimeloyl-ACP methyl ester carboxylesterase|nr:alpha/beta hydrolase [Actinomycetota bacterium]
MSEIVLVHGAWGGSYGFKKLRPLLTAHGHEVFTPSLTGIGERSHLVNPSITLETHVTDVVNTILYEDLTEILLLGFSYGGMVATGALEMISDRVKHLVYLDAFVPGDGQSVTKITGQWAAENSLDPGTKWLVPPIPREADKLEDTLWFGLRRSMQPLGTFTQTVTLSKPLEELPLSRTYIKATADENEANNSHFWQSAKHAHESRNWEYFEIATNHLVAINRPDELAKVLLEIIGE